MVLRESRSDGSWLRANERAAGFPSAGRVSGPTGGSARLEGLRARTRQNVHPMRASSSSMLVGWAKSWCGGFAQRDDGSVVRSLAGKGVG